jgi:hypothetical protein
MEALKDGDKEQTIYKYIYKNLKIKYTGSSLLDIFMAW